MSEKAPLEAKSITGKENKYTSHFIWERYLKGELIYSVRITALRGTWTFTGLKSQKIASQFSFPKRKPRTLYVLL